MQTIYILIAIVALFLIGILFWSKSRQSTRTKKKPSQLAFLGMLLVVMAIMFGENRWVGYTLIAAGICLAVADIIFSRK
jgi:peptidoglycan/LPS O-acetylase OafA/YrhL